MSGQQPIKDDISRDVYGVEQFANTIISSRRWSERRDLCSAYVRKFDEERLDAFANQLKSRCIDARLQAQLREARTLALTLQLLGEMTQHLRCVALGLLARADVDRQRGANLKAIALYNQAARAFLDASDRIGWARARGGWLLATSYAGQVTTKDLQEMETVCQALRDAGELDRLARVKNNIGMAWQQLSYFHEALTAFEEGLTALTASARPEWLAHKGGQERLSTAAPPDFVNQFAMTIANKATTFLWQGQLADAAALFEVAQELFARINNGGNIALVKMRRGNLARQRGRVREALRHAQAAVIGLRAAGLTKHAALALMYWADILLLLNRTREADAAIREAIDLLPAHDSPSDRIHALSLRARMLASRRLYDQAVECVNEAEQLSALQKYTGITFPLDHLALTRAELLLAKGETAAAYEAALALLPRQVVVQISLDQRSGDRAASDDHAERDRNHGVVQEPPEPPVDTEFDQAHALVVAAEAALKGGDHASARALAQAVIVRSEALSVPELEYFGHRVLARAARLDRAFDLALAHYDAAHQALRATIDDLVYDQWAGFLQDKDVIFTEGCMTALEASDPLRALTFLEMARARAVWRLQLSAGHLARRSTWDDGTEDETTDLETLLQGYRGRRAYLWDKLKGDQTRAPVEQELDHLSHHILDQLAAWSERKQESLVLDGATLLARVPRQATAIAYALIGDALVIFVIAGQRLVAVHHDARGAKQVRSLARELRMRIADLTVRGLNPASPLTDESLARWNRDWQAMTQDLFALLIKPVEPHLPADGGTLTIIPHHALHALPMASLYDGSRYLLERWGIRYAPSLQAYGAQSLLRESSPAGPPRLLALGHSNGGQLPQNIDQARAIAHMFGGAPLLEADATGARLREDCVGQTYLHIVTHGEWYEDAPYAAFIQLADGPFQPTDALLLDLRGCRLVTLAACQTGQGYLSGGDAYVGLSQVFHEAGADAVLATFWRVEANATLLLMERFYGALARGMEPHEALRSAQLLSLHEPAASLLASPFGWAAFHLTEYVLHPERPAQTN